MTETTAPISATTAHDGPTRGTNLATLGFLMAATGAILLVAAPLLWGLDSGDVAFFAFPAVLGLVGAALIRRSRTVWKVMALVLAIVVAGGLFWTAFGLTTPASFLDFVPGLLVLPGVLLALAAGITSIRSGKQGRPVGPGERRATMGILGVLGLLAVASAVLTATGRETVDADLAADADLVVDLENFEFDQASYEVTGEGIVLVKNSDPFVHNFTIDELDIDVDLNPFSEKLITLPDQPGTYVLFCEPHTEDPDDPSDDDMAAELRIG